MSLTKVSYSMINGAVANVFDFGATGDGTTDDTAAIQAALNSGASIVEIPLCSNFYKVTSPIKIPMGVAIRGRLETAMIGTSVQSNTPRITKTTNTTVGIPRYNDSVVVQRDCVFYTDYEFDGIYYPQNFEVNGLSICGDAATLVTYGIYHEEGSNLTVKDCNIFNVQHGFYARSIWISTFTNVKLASKFTVENGGTSLVLTNCSTVGSSTGYDGFNLTALQYSTLISCTGDNGLNPVYTLQFCSGVSLISCGCESNDYVSTTNGWAINSLGSNTLSVIGFNTVPKAGSTTPIISTYSNDNIDFINCYLANNKSAVPSMKDLHADFNSIVTFDNCVFNYTIVPVTDNPQTTILSADAQVIVKYGNNIKVINNNGYQTYKFDNGLVVGDTQLLNSARFYGKSQTGYGGAIFRSDSDSAASASWYHLYGTSSSNTVANIAIYGNGNIQNANNSYGALSDKSVKENIVEASPKLNDLLKVKIKNFNLKTSPELKQIGVIAQDLETVFPSMVEQDEKGIKSVKYSVFVPILIKAIQELKAEVDALKGN